MMMTVTHKGSVCIFMMTEYNGINGIYINGIYINIMVLMAFILI